MDTAIFTADMAPSQTMATSPPTSQPCSIPSTPSDASVANPFSPTDSTTSLATSLSSDLPDNEPTSPCDDKPTTDALSGPLSDATPILFGHGPNAWKYLPLTQRFDLTRNAPTPKLYLRADPAQRNHRGCLINPAQPVLVIVDMQNYFIHPACAQHPGGLAAIPALLQVMARARDLGIQIAFLNWVIGDADLRAMPPAVQRGFCAQQLAQRGVGWRTNLGAALPGAQGRCLWEGSWNAALHADVARARRPDDLEWRKNRPSGMWSRECDMFRYLERAGKHTVMFAGVNTDQCVLGTLTDCYSNGFDCLLVKDCTATASAFMANELCEWNVATNYGFVVDSASILGAELE